MWHEAGRRLFINPYLDRFPVSHFHRVTVSPPYEVPLFDVQLLVKDSDVAALCARHFRILKVVDKSRKECVLYYMAFRRDIGREMVAGLISAPQMTARLADRAAGFAAAWGENAWAAALFRALPADDARRIFSSRIRFAERGRDLISGSTADFPYGRSWSRGLRLIVTPM